MAQGRSGSNKPGVIIVSACLLGVPCRYNGKHAYSSRVFSYVKNLPFVPVCPEVMAGLGVPRSEAWFVGGDGEEVLKGNARIVTENGDVTAKFIMGARAVLALLKGVEIRGAVLKEGSPSCGVERVNVGGNAYPGKGVLTAILEKMGVRVISNEKILGEPSEVV